jgi:hypothetical protein
MFIITGFLFPSSLTFESHLKGGRYPIHFVRDMYTGTVDPRRHFFEDNAYGSIQYRNEFIKIVNWRSGPRVISFSLIRIDSRDSTILRFRQRDRTSWLGTYDGPTFGKGLATCVISECDDDSLSADYVKSRLSAA